MLTDYGVRVIRAYENRLVGQVFYPTGLLRDALVRKGLVERVQPPAEDPPVSEDAPLLDRAMRSSRRRSE
jgi:hypothetical protein